MILATLLLVLVSAYAWYIIRCTGAWLRIPDLSEAEPQDHAFFSVIIPVRNEARNIMHLLQDLENQSYPKDKFEVLVIDDHSEDDTPELVKQFLQASSLHIKLLFLASFPERRQKKGAIEVGIGAAEGDWILCTDGDCRVSPQWLATMNQCRIQSKALFISGPVMLSPNGSFFQNLQALEFLALIGVGAAGIQLRRPTMCNGANLAYSKTAFLAVHGFAGNSHLPSGDDEFLLHKIQAAFPGQVSFLKAREAIVHTPAAPTLKAFLQQRVRWASKWRHYESTTSQLVAAVVLGANLALWVGLALALSGSIPWLLALLVWLVKLIPDILLFCVILPFFRKKKLLSLVVVLQVAYAPYILVTAMLGLKGKYQWKGREHVNP
ncbi:MAG: glycosyltransferase family 2 protein [Rufibacter sp.]